MTPDRLERVLPDVLTELAIPRVPDYVDTILNRVERTQQRPGWTFPERWLPVTAFSATVSPTRLPIRLIVTVGLLIALAAGLLVIANGALHRLPPPFGLARNGLVVTNDTSGNIVTVDPATGTSRTLIAGPGLCCATFSPDGQRLVYLHVPVGDADPTSMTVARADGTTLVDIPRDLLTGLADVEWAPSGDELVISSERSVVVIDATNGRTTTVAGIPAGIVAAAFIGTSNDVLVTSHVSDTIWRLFRSRAGGTGSPEQVAELEYAVNPPLISPDGSKFLYFIWAPEARLHGDIHVHDLATGSDTAITEERFDDGYEWENPVWSPDGSLIAAEQYAPGGFNRVAVLPATGGTATLVGKPFPTGQNGAAIRFSPDGKSLLVTYRNDSTNYLLPVDGSEGRQVSWSSTEDMSWQRLGP